VLFVAFYKYLQLLFSLYRKDAGNKSDTHGVIGITGEESPIRVKGYMAGSSFSDIDIAQAKLEGRNLLGELYQAHGLKYFEKVDELGYNGLFDSDYDRKDATKEWDAMTDTELLTFVYNTNENTFVYLQF